jgi:hypothetical protein
MEQWLVMGAVVLVICIVHPPFLGAVIGVGGIMLATVLLYKLVGG